MKFKEIVLSLGVCLMLFGCGQSIVLPKIDQQLKPSHKKLLEELLEVDSTCKSAGIGRAELVCQKRRIYKRTVKQGQTWHGKWFYTLTKEEVELNPKAKVYSVSLDPTNGKYIKGMEISLEKLSSDDVFLTGFLSLNGRPGDLIVETSFANQQIPIKNFKNVQKIVHWETGDEDNKVEYNANYDPSTDVIYGQIKSKLWEGTFRASRISEATFKRLAGPGVINPRIPLYIISD